MNTKEIKPVVYNGVGFYPVPATSKTEDEFVQHEKHHTKTKENPDAPLTSEEQLKEVYKLCQEAVKPREEKKEESTPTPSAKPDKKSK